MQHLKPSNAKGYYLPDGFNQEGESGSDYLTDYLTDMALKEIDATEKQPFFLYFAYHTPHTPIQGRADLVDYYEPLVKPGGVHTNPKFAAMVHSLDQSVGRLMARLRERGIDKNTLVLFISDNGGLTQRYGKRDLFTENLPLRRGKGSAYEGGVRVPMIVHWPDVIPDAAISHTPVITTDIYPTLLEVSAVSADKASTSTLDGMSLIPVLRDPSTPLKRDLFWHYPHYHAGGDGPYSAIRSGPWRLIEFHESNRVELYNLDGDLGEANDLATSKPKQARQLLGRLQMWRTSIDAQMPRTNPQFDPAKQTQVVRAKRK